MDDNDRPYDASEPKDVKARVREAQRWDDRRSRVILSIMGSEDGRRWIRELIELHPIGATVFSKDALAMAYAEGERMICARIMSEVMNAAPQLYMQMMAEASPKAREQKDETDRG